MKRSTRKSLQFTILFLVVAAGVVPAAHAQGQSGGYLGVSVGQAKASDACAEEPGLVITSCDDTDTSFKIFGGYKLNPHIAVEVGYVDLGTVTASGIALGLPFDASIDISGFTFQAVGMVPVGQRVSLMGKAGLIYWNLDASANVSGFTGSTSDSGADLAVGIGAQFSLSKNVGIRADLDYYPNLGNNDTGESNVTAISLGLVFSF